MAAGGKPIGEAETGLRGGAGKRSRSRRGRKTGPLIDGKKECDRARGQRQPTSQPPTASPHRRPARLAAWISSGLATTLKTSVSIHVCPAGKAAEGVIPMLPSIPVAGLGPAIHASPRTPPIGTNAWMAGSSPATGIDHGDTQLLDLPASEPAGLVDEVAQRLAGEEAAAIVEDDLVAPLVEIGAVAGDMRGQ
jgi:hypothetical protein